jgi:hypothetical protein
MDDQVIIGHDVFLSPRMGISWPTANNPGYLCITGIEAVRDVRYPTVCLLSESEENDRERLFNRIIAQAKNYNVNQLYALLKNSWMTIESKFISLCRSRNVEGLRLNDATEWSGFEAALPVIKEKALRGATRIPSGILRNQLDIMTPESIKAHDRIPAEDRFYAVNAFCHAICSYELFLFKKKQKHDVKKQREGYR